MKISFLDIADIHASLVALSGLHLPPAAALALARNLRITRPIVMAYETERVAEINKRSRKDDDGKAITALYKGNTMVDDNVNPALPVPEGYHLGNSLTQEDRAFMEEYVTTQQKAEHDVEWYTLRMDHFGEKAALPAGALAILLEHNILTETPAQG